MSIPGVLRHPDQACQYAGGAARYLARMQEIIARELEQIHIPCTISGRPKHLYSIYQKMQRQQLTFEEIHDILAAGDD